MIAMNCPDCGTPFGTASTSAGKTEQCPHCKKVVPVPLQSDPHLYREPEPTTPKNTPPSSCAQQSFPRWFGFLQRLFCLNPEAREKRNTRIIEQLQRECVHYRSHLEGTDGKHAGVQSAALPNLGAVRVVDLRSGIVRQIESDARSGRSVGPVFDRLVEEIIAIGATSYYADVKKKNEPGYDNEGDHMRTQEIGRLLNDGGGMLLMQAAAYRVRFAALAGRTVQGAGRNLDFCWNGIGEWQS